MKRDEFQKIINSFDDMHQIAKDINDSILIESENISCRYTNISMCTKTLKIIQDLQSQMDLALTDAYHIIGMGNLNASQGAIFLKKFKSMVNDRARIKHAFCVLTAHRNYLGNINSETGRYQTKILNAKQILIGKK